MKLRYTALPAALLLTIGLLSGCSDNQGAASENTNVEQVGENKAAAGTVSMELDKNSFTVQTWKMDNSQVVPIHGRMALDGKPVAGVEVNLAGKRSVKTSENGEFQFMLDVSIPQSISVNVKSTDEATVAGGALQPKDKDALLAAKQDIDVYYPIKVTEVKPSPTDANMVEVHGRAVQDESEGDFPITTVTHYALMGMVKDASGAPIKDATVSIVRDKGEGWSRSEPSDDKGNFILYYQPEDDEDMDFNVFVGKTKYTLPENKVYRFPDDTSIEISITLPETGTVIDDKPPTLVSKPTEGAVHWSLAVGVSVDPDVKYAITMPKKDGSFVLTIPKAEWEKNPTFFETRVSKFLLEPLKAGDIIPESYGLAPQENDPKKIVAEKE